MKRLKKGFTLAEVLITLSIIGIVAAVVMPSVMANYQYKTMGTKLSKFLATTEAAARPFVINNDNFLSKDDVQGFVDESFLGKGIAKFVDGKLTLQKDGSSYEIETGSYPTTYNLKTRAADDTTKDLLLKDGTSINVYKVAVKENDASTSIGYTDDEKKNDMFNPAKYGSPAFLIRFNTNIQGLPKEVRSSFDFVVTDIGYLLPKTGDECMKYLYGNGFAVNAKDFLQTDGACYVGTDGKVPAKE